MLADFLAVVPRIPALTLITYRPEYRGPLSQMPGAQTIALRPLSDAQAATLTAQLVGAEPQLGELTARVAERAGGNPFFAEEMVRDLAERGVLHGQPGAYSLRGDVDDADVPATLHATIGARIDRLDPVAKRTLERGGGHRIPVRRRPAGLPGRRPRRGTAYCRRTRRPDEVRPAPSIRVSASADPHRRLRITTQIRSRTTTPAARIADRGPRSGFGRRERGPDRGALRVGRRSARSIRMAHARRCLGQLPRQQRGCQELAKSTAGRRSTPRRSTQIG